MCKIKLYLYIASATPEIKASAEEIESVLRKKLKGQYSMEVVSLLDNPERAEKEGIFATPFLSILEEGSPNPVKRILGDLNSMRTALGIWIETQEKG